MKKIAFVVGSLRENSYSIRWAKKLNEFLPEGYEGFFPEIGDLALYNEDLDSNEDRTPESYKRFRKEMAEAEAVVFVTPEYNRGVPAAIKNALDVGSRPYGQSIWQGKPAMVVSHSISSMAGALSNHALRQSLVFLDMPTLQQPELYLANSGDLLDEEGNIIGEGTEDFLKGAVQSFIAFAEKLI